MITIQHPIDLPDTYPLERLGPLERLLFFDIETTGFSGDSSSLYLIGCAFHSEGGWNLIQWFADTPEAEPELLRAFFSFLSRYPILIHFNGDGFDIPYLLKRCRHYGLPYGFSGVDSVDIYRKIRPYRSLLGLESMKQKAVERFLGIFRSDPYTGGQLIEVYQDYLETKSAKLYDMLILHNEEDLTGMPLILPVLNYCDMLEGGFTFLGQSFAPSCGNQGRPDPILELSYESPYSVPVDWAAASGPFRLSCSQNRLTCSVQLAEGELKHFYPDYQDYYYLPLEDTAIHKSVGEFVDRSARKKATAATCYTRRQGIFLPQPVPMWEPAFKAAYRDKLCYSSYGPGLISGETAALEYLHGVLSLLCPKPGGKKASV